MAQHTIRDDNRGLKVLVDRESQTALDIVFVHGLRGHRINTWSSSDNICWPKDILPEDIKDSRILTFGYDAQVAGFLSTTSQASIFAHAEKLLDNLKNARRGAETRPIIFIGHSLGGIIIKDALIRSWECKHSTQDVRLGAIFNATIGVIFMATPHRGSHTASLAQYAVTAAKIALQNPNRHIIDGLKVDSQILEKQRTSFGAIIEPSKLRCAYEELPTHTQLIVGAASAMIDGVISVAIEADHVAICKFGSREDTGYDTIRGWILDMRENDSLISSFDRDLFMQLLDKHADHYQVVSVDHPSRDTCEWFTNHPIYLEWWNSPSHMLKWLFAEKGCGKSVLLQHIFNWAMKKKKQDIVCRFFFRNSKSSAHAMICAILHQIFSQRPQLLSFAAKHCNGRDIPSAVADIETSKLFGIFLEIATVSKSDKIVCIIDALDECPTQPREDLIHHLENMFSTHAKESGVRMLISMRPDPAVARKFGISTIVRYDELVGFEDDIQRMIVEKINHMDLREQLKDRLRSELPQRAGHTFLLASLILATISKQKSLRPSDLNSLVLSEKPTDLYENALCSRPAHIRDRAFRLLKIVLVAAEALTPGQLDTAECLDAGDCSLTDLNRESNPEDALRDVCGVLLCVLNGKVFIFHETVREYLSERDDFNPTGIPANCLASLPDAHQVLADSCIWLLSLDDWDQFQSNEDIKSSIREARAWLRWRMDDKTFCAEDIKFLGYAAANWFRHVDMSMNIQAKLSNINTTEGDLVLGFPTEGSKKICDITRSSTALWMRLADMSSSEPGEIARYGSPSLIASFYAFAIAPIDRSQVRFIEALADGIVRYEQDVLWKFLVYQCRASPQLTQMLFNVACKYNWQVGMRLCQIFEVSVDLAEALRNTLGFISTTTLRYLLDNGAVVDHGAIAQVLKQGNAKHMAILLKSCDEASQNALRPLLQDSLRVSLSDGNFELASVLISFRDVDVNYHELADTWMHDEVRNSVLHLDSRTLELYHMFTDHSDGCKSWQTHWRNETYDGLQDFEYNEAALETMLLSSLLWPQYGSYGSRHRAMVQTVLQMGAKLTMDDDKLELLFELLCHACWNDEDLVYFLHHLGGMSSAILRGRTIEHLITAALGRYHSTFDHILGLVSESSQLNIDFLNFQGCSLIGALLCADVRAGSDQVYRVLHLGADPDLRTSGLATEPKMIGQDGREALKRWADEDSMSLAAMVVAGFIRTTLKSVDDSKCGYNPKNLPVCVCSADTEQAFNLIARRSEYIRRAYELMYVADTLLNDTEKPPLAIACDNRNWAVAKLLLDHKASPSVMWEGNGLKTLFGVHVEEFRIGEMSYDLYGNSLFQFLHLLQSVDLLAEFIDHREQSSGSTLVHFIMLADNRECDKFLSRIGIDLNIRNTDGETPLHWYMYRKGPTNDLTHNSRSRLFTRFDLTIKSPGGASFLDAIFEGGRNSGSEACFASVESFDLCTRGSYFLHKAIRAGARDWIDFFACLENFDLNAQDEEGATALHLAVMQDDVATTLMLLSKAIWTDILDEWGKAPMHYAVLGSRDIMRALTDSGSVDLGILSLSGMTPLLEVFVYGAATDAMVTNVRLLVNALIARAHFDDRIEPLDFVTNSIPYFQRTGEELPELLRLMQSLWTPDPQSEIFTWDGSDSEDSDWMSSEGSAGE